VLIVITGALLRKRRQKAREQVALQTKEFSEFSNSQVEYLVDWMKQVKDYEDGSSDKNPYGIVHHGNIVMLPLT